MSELILDRIVNQYGVPIVHSSLPDIGKGLHAFLLGIYSALRNYSKKPPELNQIHLDILCLLKIAQTSLGVSIIFHCLVRGGLFFLDSDTFQREISVLVRHRLIMSRMSVGCDVAAVLTSQGDKLAEQEIRQKHQDLLFSELLYSGILDLIETGTLTEFSFATLLYRLSNTVDQKGQMRWRKAAIKSCIATSSYFEASAILERVKNEIQYVNDDDTLTIIAAMIATKKYQKALAASEAIVTRTAKIEILRAILHYRCLDLDEAHKRMTKLLPVVRDPNDRCLLKTYYIALAIDRGEITPQVERLIASKADFENENAYGYLLNIIAATQTPEDSIKTCKRSFKAFERSGDHFGLGGAWANLCVHQIKGRKFSEGIKSGKEAYDQLSRFGIQHVHLAANNLATAFLLKGDVDQASLWVRKSLDLLQTSTIRINALTNLVATEFLQGQTEIIHTTLNEAARHVVNQPIRAVTQKFCHNAQLMCDFSSMPADLANLCEQYPLSDMVQRQVDGNLNDRVAYLQKHYDPPTNQYWFPNPMDLFDKQTLSIEAYF